MGTKSWTGVIMMLGIGAIALDWRDPDEARVRQRAQSSGAPPTAAGNPELLISTAALPAHLRPTPRNINALWDIGR